MTERFREELIPAYLLLCLVLGGASAAGLWANMLLQLIAIVIIVWSLLSRPAAPLSDPARRLLLLAGCAVALVAVQLVPLPPALWTLLPGRDAVAEGYDLLGVALPWLPISLAPFHTMASALWLLPALAMLIGMLRLGFSRNGLAWAIVIVAALSLPLGLLQVTAGSFFYPYEISDFGHYAGLFANAAHLAALLLIAAPFMVALYLAAGTRKTQPDSGIQGQRLWVLLAALAIAAGLILSASLAAFAPLVPILIACICIYRRHKRRLSHLWLLPIVLFSFAYVGLASLTSFQNSYVWEESVAGPNSRDSALGTSVAAAVDFQPLGSGIGTFADVYRRYEDVGAVGRTYLNHVHNDYIELLLETGLLGFALLTAFLIWWGRRTYAIWLSNESGPLQRAATVASGALLLQSAVGYPLRTAALSTVFATCCALMARPRSMNLQNEVRKPSWRRPRHLTAN